MDSLTAPTPLAAPPPEILQSEPWMGSVTTDTFDQSVSEECLLKVDLPVRDTSYECLLCLKMFGTANSLNKHLLTHQQDRPHVCSICQRAFKRQDHLSGHMLTHQKRKQFPCSEPGCRKSYYDSHSLKRHYLSQHISPFVAPVTQHLPPPSLSAQTQWEPLDRPAVFSGGSADTSSYHSVFLCPTQTGCDKLQHCSDLSAFSSYSSNDSSAAQEGSLVTSCPEPELFQSKPVLALAPWKQGSDKGPCNECTGELHPSQWNPDPQVQEKAQAQVHFSSLTGPPGPGTQSWDGRIDIPVSDLQALEEIMSYDPCSVAAGAGIDSTVMPFPAPEMPSQCKQVNIVKQPHSHMNSEGKPQEKLHLYSLENTKSSSCSTLPTKPVPSAAHSLTQFPLPKQPPASGLPPPSLPPALYSTVKSKTGPEMKKRSQRRQKFPPAHPPALPLPSVPPPSSSSPLLAQWRPQPRPLHLVSPSQVAMASFSERPACQNGKAGKPSVLGEEAACASEWVIPNFPRENKASEGPSGSAVETESHFPESEASESQVERSPAEHMALSPLVIPVSVAVMTEPDLVYKEREDGTPDSCSRRPWGNRRLDFLKNLIIPPPAQRQLPTEEVTSGARGRAAGGYPSQLRSPMYLVDHLLNPSSQPPPYTPPPMLSPLRPGTGLYFSTLPPPHPCPPSSTYTATLDGVDGITMEMDDTVVSIKPRINVGQRFQAEIPPTRNLLLMLYDEHPAQLVWAPWGDLATNTDTQRRVDELLDLCCSSVLPGGGTNTELALHCLHEVQGDSLAALDLLLMRGDYRCSTHPLSDYHYTGSDHWTPQEKKLFCKVLLTHEKDFQLVHSELQTKSVSQCVEYYYSMKKIKKFKPRSSNRGSYRREGADTEVMDFPEHTEDNPPRRGSRRTLLRPDYRAMGLLGDSSASGGALEYACRECGRVFDRVKSRNAHMKTHRKVERQWLSRYSWSAGCLPDEPHQEPTPGPHPTPGLHPTPGPHNAPLSSSRGFLFT